MKSYDGITWTPFNVPNLVNVDLRVLTWSPELGVIIALSKSTQTDGLLINQL